MRFSIIIERQNTHAKAVVTAIVKLVFTRHAKAVRTAMIVSRGDMEDANKMEDACETAVPLGQLK